MRPRDLLKRVQKLNHAPTSNAPDLEAVARDSWIVCHLTEGEQVELAKGIKYLIDLGPGKATESEMDAVHALQQLGEQRALQESASAWETFKTKSIRAEQIRNTLRISTDKEKDGLSALNRWFWDHGKYDPATRSLVSLDHHLPDEGKQEP